MSIEHLIEHYGLLAIFVGAGIEGEAVVFLGGVLAHRGLLRYWQVACAASLGSFMVDQLLFFTGRYARGNARVQTMMSHPIFAHVTDLLERYPTGFTLAFRFIYGMRTISPVAIGMSRIAIPKFIALNALAAAVWGPAIAGVGFVFGHGIEAIFGRFPLAWHVTIAAATVIALMFAVFLYQKYAEK